jgi:hypothetical protein
MSAIEEYVKRADECLREAGACIAESNRAIFMDVAAKWRMLAKEAEAGAVPAPPATAVQGTAVQMMPATQQHASGSASRTLHPIVLGR